MIGFIMKIVPIDKVGPYRTGSLEKVSYNQIVETLGFKENVEDDPDKVKYSWGFEVDGKFAAIWDYKGSHVLKMWSTYDPDGILKSLFGGAVHE